jgi:hypothetical protein
MQIVTVIIGKYANKKLTNDELFGGKYILLIYGWSDPTFVNVLECEAKRIRMWFSVLRMDGLRPSSWHILTARLLTEPLLPGMVRSR